MRVQRGSVNTRWLWRGSALALLVIGWVFILLTNNFHVTPSVVFVCLGYLAGVVAIYTLFRTGASAVARNEEDDGIAEWGRPMGPVVELEREKRTLLKAIKEAEFDLEMGKLSKADAEGMIRTYRARAIEVIKELERRDGISTSVRESIEREVRARLSLEDKQVAKQPKKSKKKAVETPAPESAEASTSSNEVEA